MGRLPVLIAEFLFLISSRFLLLRDEAISVYRSWVLLGPIASSRFLYLAAKGNPICNLRKTAATKTKLQEHSNEFSFEYGAFLLISTQCAEED